MKTSIKQMITFFFSALILFHGCTVYKSANVTLEEASKTETKVKVETKDNRTMKFNRIGVENGRFYGVNKSKGEMIQTPLDKNNLISVMPKDETLSTILTIGLPVVIIGLAIFIIVDRYCCFEFGSGTGSSF